MTMTGSATVNRWALLVVDMQNAFCHDEGSFAQMLADTDLTIEQCKEATRGCRRLIRHARDMGSPVIYTRFVFHQDYRDGGILVEKYPAILEKHALAANSWDGEIVAELQPGPRDLVIDKSRYSAFIGTRLGPLLTSMRIQGIVICGVTTNVCVESTARDAAQYDYQTIVVSDACGELDSARHEHALDILGYGFATIMTVDEVEAAYR
jgi:ureidoacrylate peracid hydrolase